MCVLNAVAKGDVPNQHKTQSTSVLSVNVFLRIPQQHVHVRVNALQLAFVLCLTPFETDDELGADPKTLY